MHKGYTYRKKSRKGEKIYFVCTVKRCHGRGVLSQGEFRITRSEHIHKPKTHDHFDEKEILKMLKKLALECNEPGPALLKALNIERNRERFLKAIRTWRCRERKKASQKQFVVLDWPGQSKLTDPKGAIQIDDVGTPNVKKESEWTAEEIFIA